MKLTLEKTYPGFRKEAEYRCPKEGEWFVASDNSVCQADRSVGPAPWLVLTPFDTPEGFEIIDYREPVLGEKFLRYDGGIGIHCRSIALDTSVTNKRLILKKIEPEYRVPDARDIGKEIEVWDYDIENRIFRKYAGVGGDGSFWAYNPAHPGTLIPWKHARVLVETS